MRVALVHDWLTGMRGGERCLIAIIQLFPDADIFTLVHRAGRVASEIEARPIHTSFVHRLPYSATRYRYYLPLFPRAIERFNLAGYDLVISTSHCVAKGVIRAGQARHLCYCFTPMRYIWDLFESYVGPHRTNRLMRSLAAIAAQRLRRWDVSASDRVDSFVACSHHIRRKIERFYGRQATVVYPPVAVDRFRANAPREDFYLLVSALVPYKRIDLAISTFNRLGRKLKIVGEGTEYRLLRRSAGPTIEFTGRLTDPEVAELMARCRAFVFPGEEDFGIAAVEAQAAGAPVIAYSAGGVLESVTDQTGVFFAPQTVEALIAAVRQLDDREFSPQTLRQNAMRFSEKAFKAGMRRAIADLLAVSPSAPQDDTNPEHEAW